MCVCIVFAVNIAQDKADDFRNRVTELGRVYQYGIGLGANSLPSGAEYEITNTLTDADEIFELHDPPEPHCACDIDDDIRLGSKLGRRSKFFDFVRETLEFDGLKSLSVLFFQEELPHEENVRKHLGGYEEFVDLLNRWNTWQVAGFEPTRQAYFIAEAAPLLYTFTDQRHSQ